MGNRAYDVKVELTGLPAYVVNRLVELGLHGRTREAAVEKIVASWILEHGKELREQGITLEDAKRRRYVSR